MLMLSVASDWQSLPSVPGRSSKRMVNSLIVGIFGFSFWYTSGMSWGGPARSKDLGILRRREVDRKTYLPPNSNLVTRLRLGHSLRRRMQCISQTSNDGGSRGCLNKLSAFHLALFFKNRLLSQLKTRTDSATTEGRA